MTLVLKLDLGMVMTYHHTKNEVSMSRYSNAIARTVTHTHPHTHTLHGEILAKYQSYGELMEKAGNFQAEMIKRVGDPSIL